MERERSHPTASAWRAIMLLTVWVSLPAPAQGTDGGTVPPEVLPRRELALPREEPPLPPGLLTPPEQEEVEELAEGERLAGLRIVGNQRVEAEVIRRALRLEPGQVLTPERLTEALRALFSLGEFADARLQTEPVPGGVVLEVEVEERPALRQVRFEGNESLRREELREVAGLEPGRALQPVEVRQAAQRLEELYRARGFALAEVVPVVEPVEGEASVDVRFVIRERQRVRVRRVSLTGALPVPAAELREVVRTRPATVLTTLTGRDYLREDVIERDEAALVDALRDLGYLQASVQSLVTLSPDHQSAYVTFVIEPGQRYRLGALEFVGEPPPPEWRAERVGLEEGEVLRASRVAEEREELVRYLQDQGYAFAEVTPLTRLRPERGVVDLLLRVERGPRVCVGEIEVVGNERTREFVIQRELALKEGAPFAGEALRRSREALQALELFQEVDVTVQPAENPCGAEVVVRVVEKQTRFYRLGFGFASVQKLVITGRLVNQNLLGRGLTLAAFGQYSSRHADFEAFLLEPYLLGAPASLRAEAFWTRADLLDFEREALGASASVGYRLGAWREPLRGLVATVGYGLQRVELEAAPELAEVLRDLGTFQDGRLSVVRLSLLYDRLEEQPFSSRGLRLLGAVEYGPGFLGGTIQLARYTLQTQLGVPLPARLLLRVGGQAGYATTLSAEPLPLSELYFLGGLDTVRGYAYQTISPTVTVITESPEGPVAREVAVGGNKQLFFNLELEFPLLTRVGLRGLIFYDAGNVFAVGEPFLAATRAALPFGLLQAVGLGVRWLSPLGPLRLEAGIPLNRRPGDRPILFEIAVGGAGTPTLPEP